jgi:ParB family chromosome partitioning protein
MPLADIHVGDGHRPPDEETVQTLLGSIAQVGLLHPVTVTPECLLIAGRQRLEAARRLGWQELPCLVLSLDDLHRELAAIDENLLRKELTRLEAYEALARRGEILAALGLRRKTGRPPEKPGTVSDFRTTAEVAAETGMSERTLQRAERLVRDLPPDVRDRIRGTEAADSLSELRQLASLAEEVQRQVAEELARQPGLKVRAAHRLACPGAFPKAADERDRSEEPGVAAGQAGPAPPGDLADAWDRAGPREREELLRRPDVVRGFRRLHAESVREQEGGR